MALKKQKNQNTKKYREKIAVVFTAFLVFIFAFFFISSAAKAALMVRLSQNEIGLEGDCSTKNITIALAETENPENVVYSGGARCNGNSFSFYDDLSKWDIENGEYALIVNGEKTNKTIKRQKNLFAVQTDFEESVVLGTENNPGESSYNSDARFLEAYASFQESLVDMQTWVGSTRYPVLVKSGIELAIDGIIAVSGRITDLVWSGENSVENNPNGY